jgi:hypothetical protein
MGLPRMMTGSGIAGGQDLILGAGGNFDLVRTSQMIVVRETPGVMRTTCRLGSSLQGVHQLESPRHSWI